MTTKPINWPQPSKAAILDALFHGTPDTYNDVIEFKDADGVEWMLDGYHIAPGTPTGFTGTALRVYDDDGKNLTAYFTYDDVTEDWVFITRRALRMKDLMA